MPEHLKEVRDRRLSWIEKTRAAVKDRLTKEINYWDHRAEELKLQEQAGKLNARLNSQEARRRADDLQARLEKRLAQLDLEGQISALPPVVLGGFVVVPIGLIAKVTGATLPKAAISADTQASAARAREIVMEVEKSLGFEPVDREFEKLGYDIESRDPGYRQVALPGGQRPGIQRRHHHRHQKRDPIFPEQARGVHPCHCRVFT